MKIPILLVATAVFTAGPTAAGDADLLAPTHPGLREGEVGDSRQRWKEAARRESEQRYYDAPPVISEAYESMAQALESLPEMAVEAGGESMEESLTIAGKWGARIQGRDRLLQRLAEGSGYTHESTKLAQSASVAGKYVPQILNFAEPVAIIAGKAAEEDYSGMVLHGGSSLAISFTSSWIGAKSGMAAGTAVGGPVGTVVGGVVGVGVSVLSTCAMKWASKDTIEKVDRFAADISAMSKYSTHGSLPPIYTHADFSTREQAHQQQLQDQINRLETLGILDPNLALSNSPGIAPPTGFGGADSEKFRTPASTPELPTPVKMPGTTAPVQLQAALQGLQKVIAAPTPSALAEVSATTPHGDVLATLQREAEAESVNQVVQQLQQSAVREAQAERQAAIQAQRRYQAAVAAENQRRRRLVVQAQQRALGAAVGQALAGAINQAAKPPFPQQQSREWGQGWHVEKHNMSMKELLIKHGRSEQWQRERGLIK